MENKPIFNSLSFLREKLYEMIWIMSKKATGSFFLIIAFFIICKVILESIWKIYYTHTRLSAPRIILPKDDKDTFALFNLRKGYFES